MVATLLSVPHCHHVKDCVDKKHKARQNCHRTHCPSLWNSLKLEVDEKSEFLTTEQSGENFPTYIWRMLVCVNLLGPHCNEEKEPKEVEQEHLKQEKKIFTNKRSYWICLVIPHDDADHKDNGDEEVSNARHNSKDQVVLGALIIDWQATDIRVHVPSSYRTVDVKLWGCSCGCCWCRCSCGRSWRYWWRWIGDFQKSCPWKKLFSISEYLNVSQLTPVEHVARIPNTEHQENDKNKNLESSTKILKLLPLTSSTNFMTNAFVARFLAAKAIFLVSDNFHELMETLRQL